MARATLHDGAVLELEVRGEGPAVLLPVNPTPIDGDRADEMRKWGADPALGKNLIDGLSDTFRVVAFDYEGHVLAHPKPATLTPDNVAADLVAVADAAGAERFAYYGYSWFGLVGLQLALRTDRLSALVMGGYPPLDGPYAEMLAVTRATHRMAIEAASAPVEERPVTTAASASDELDWSSAPMTLSTAQTRQFVTLYEALAGFDDEAAQERLRCPRLCFAGSKDTIPYDEKWGGVVVDMAGPLARRRAELERLGWEVRSLEGLDHMGAMQARTVLSVVRPWLESVLPR